MAPFGWTKSFNIQTKGHPLAENARVVVKRPAAPRARIHPRSFTLRSSIKSPKQSDSRLLGKKAHHLLSSQKKNFTPLGSL